MKRIDYTKFNAISISDDEIVMFSGEYNYCLIIDRKALILKDIEVLPEEEFVNKNLVSDIIKWQDDRIFIPRNAKYLYKKSKGKKIERIDIEMAYELKENNKFMCAAIFDNCLFLFGHWINKIIGINLVSGKLDFVYEIPKEFVLMKEMNNDAFFSSYYRENEKVYLPFLSGGYVVVFDMGSRDVEWKRISDQEEGFSSIYKEDNGIFLLCRRNRNGLILFDEENGLYKDLFSEISFKYAIGMYKCENRIWIPCYDRYSLVVDLVKEDYEKIENRYMVVKQENNHYIVCGCKGIEIFDKRNNGELLKIDFKGYDELIKRELQDIEIPFGGIAFESDQFDLSNLIEVI